MHSVGYSLFVLFITLLCFAGFGVHGSAVAADFEIMVKSGTRAFIPQVTKIRLGDKVTWSNEDQQDHFLTSAGPSTKQVVIGTENLEIHKLLKPGESYTHIFKTPETYFYFCAIHMQMWGTVIVEK